MPDGFSASRARHPHAGRISIGSGRRIAFAALGLLLSLIALPAAALTLSGNAVAVKTYAFTLQGYEVYVLGVDSVERGQNCTIGRRDWDCAAAAFRHLEEIVYEGPVTCETVFGPDEDDRVVAVCTMNGADLGERMIADGFGLAMPNETTRYEAVQAAARAAGIGLWQSEFTPPAILRSRPMSPQSTRPRFYPAAPIN